MPTLKELTNIRVTHVSYVRKGANKKEFFLVKSDSAEAPGFQKEFDVFLSKSDDDKKLVYGVVYEPDAIDAQNEFAKADTIEAAAHGFLEDCRNVDLQHNFQPGVGTVVESYIAPADFTIGEQSIKKGSWVLVTKASDEVWADIKKGVITGYSMAGKAEKTAATQKNDSSDYEVKGFFDALKSFFVSKSETAEENVEGEGSKMDKIEIQETLRGVITEALKPLFDKLDTLDKQEKPEQSAPEPSEQQDELATVVKAALDEAIKPLGERISAIEK